MFNKVKIIAATVLVALVALVVAVPVALAAPPGSPSYQTGVWEVAAELAGSFLFLVAVATAIEAVVSHFQWLVDKLPGESPKTYVVGILGIGFSVLFGINVFEALAVSVDFQPPNLIAFHWAGLVLTGLLAGSGAQVVHNWLKNLGVVVKSEAAGERRGWP
jgi:hypothetical protein